MELKKFQFKTELQEKYSATIKGIFFVDNQKGLLHLHHIPYSKMVANKIIFVLFACLL